MVQRNTKETFIAKAITTHGNKYNYDKVIFTKLSDKVEIICPRHNSFFQIANNHIRGAECPVCGHSKHGIKRRMTTKDFVNKAIIKHGNKYIYDKTIYKTTHEKLIITCVEHGDFTQTASDHLQGCGCPKCGIKTHADKTRNTIKTFIKKAKAIHGDKYSYNNVNYINSKKPVLITCRIHGDFLQLPGHHIKGSGCVECAETGFIKSKPGLLYFVNFDKPVAKFWKIGITNFDLKSRFKQDSRYIVKHHLWKFLKGEDAYNLEQIVLQKYKVYRHSHDPNNILLKCSGNTECFKDSLPYDELYNFIQHHPITREKSSDYIKMG